MFYIEDNNYVIVLYNEDRQLIEDTQQHLPQYSSLEIKETEEGYTIVDYELMTIEQAEEIIARKERERLDALTLTPADVERALLAAKGWDFDDLKTFLKNEQGYTDLQIKAIGVELRANDFFRGAVLKGTNIRIVDTIGALLGYNSDDMDYLFENKELPEK